MIGARRLWPSARKIASTVVTLLVSFRDPKSLVVGNRYRDHYSRCRGIER